MAELSGGHCTRFTAKYCLNKKSSEKSTPRRTSAIWSIFADLNRPLSAKFPEKRCTIDVNLTSTEVSSFSLFLKLESF